MRSHGIAEEAITITVSTTAEQDTALVTVRDSGPGIDVHATGVHLPPR
jgi:anti-sigma regulatory factor (Ser/Thr protein kinase)